MENEALDVILAKYYFFNPDEYGRIYVFIDFGNVRAWAKDLWKEENKFRICVEVDIEKLAKVCNLVKPEKKRFYYGHFHKNEEPADNTKHFQSILRISKARKSGFQVETKEIKMIPHYDDQGVYLGKIPKCNFDVEIAMDMLLKVEKYDTVVLFSGDSDFVKLLSYIKNKGKKIIVVCTRKSMSKELDEVKDKFIPAESLKHLLRYENQKNTPPVRAEV
ncbi:MAG: NYN domain-containing protein [Candidatus Staskawiczbacteria bacterium]